MSVSPTIPNVAVPLRPLAETAAQFRQECSALDHLVEELFRDIERLRDEVLQKSDEVEEGRRKLSERGRLLADQRKETNRLVSLLEQQEVRIAEALAEIKSLREQSAHDRDEDHQRESARFTLLEQQLRAAEGERDQLRHEVNVLQATAAASGGGSGSADSLAPLMAEFGDMRRQLSETQSQLADARTQIASAIEKSATAAAPSQPDVLSPLMAELGDMRRQVTETQTQLADAKKQLSAAIEKSAAASPAASDHVPPLMAELAQMRQELAETKFQLADAIQQAAAAVAQAPASVVASQASQPDKETAARVSTLEHERVELEAELELVRTRATELQEVVNQQRRELVEQRADVTTELRLLRELVESRPQPAPEFESDEDTLVGASVRGEPIASTPDPVVSSVMAQFARLQKDVAQRRKKK